MRDILSDIFDNEPLDPMVSARQGARAAMRKRFYQQAHVGDAAGAGATYALLLDGKPVMTPARRGLVAPSRALADVLADEWQAQEEVIDPARMPMTRLANVIIDGVAVTPGPVADEIVKYLGSDLLCYRADAPPGLVARQNEAWNPVLDWARDQLAARFLLVEGVVFADQPPQAIAAARAAIPIDAHNLAAMWRLGAMASITTVTGSALIALALDAGAFDPAAMWTAAHVDEDWQMAQWGLDDMALARRAGRLSEYEAAVKVLKFAA